MAYGWPQMSYIGFPLAVACAGHDGVGFRAATSADAAALEAHFLGLDPTDRRMRFCATVDGATIARHVAGLWSRRTLVLAAHDGPLWGGIAPIRALAELSIDGPEAELGISVDASLRRRGVGTYLVQTAGHLLRPRGVRRITAYTLPGNRSFQALAHACNATLNHGPDEVEACFDVQALAANYQSRRAGDYVWLAATAMGAVAGGPRRR